MPSKQERLDRTLETAYNDCGVKASHFAAEKNRLESVFATLSVPAIISLGSLWADSNDIVFKLVAVFATGFFFAYAVLIGWDLAAADRLRHIAIKNYRHFDTIDWSKKDNRVEDLLAAGSPERANYERLYEMLGTDFYWSWLHKLIIAVGIGGLITAGYALAIGNPPAAPANNAEPVINVSETQNPNGDGNGQSALDNAGGNVGSGVDEQVPVTASGAENSQANQLTAPPKKGPNKPCTGVHC